MNTLLREENLVNLFKVVSLAILSISSSVYAGTWCVMDEVTTVDTSGNLNRYCWVSGNLNVNGVLKEISYLSICGNSDAAANSRNLSLSLTAFTANKKLAFWFESYSSCDEVKSRWEDGATRISIKN